MKVRTMAGRTVVFFLAGLVLSSPAPVRGQTAETLAPGAILEGFTDWDEAAVYGFSADAAGVLTVIVRSLDGADVHLLVADGDGQPLPNGRSDQDLGGDAGAEQFAVTLPRAGEYQVRVETYSQAPAPFKIGVSWLSFPDLAVPADPDGSPSMAVPISIGQATMDDRLDGPGGDYWDWFVLRANKAGTLTVATRADDGDLVLEAFSPGEFTEAMERSDQDLQGNGGNEALTLVVESGDEYFFKVSAFSDGASIPYRLQVGFIPNQ